VASCVCWALAVFRNVDQPDNKHFVYLFVVLLAASAEYKKVKESQRPGQAQRVPGGSRFQDTRHTKVLGTGRLYPSSKYSWFCLLLEAESTAGP